jgi:hypothetical protein
MNAPPPTFLNRPRPAPKPRGDYWRWFAAIFLIAALPLQIAVADRVRVAADPIWRPRIESLCGLLRCELPPWRELGALHVTSRDIRPHPTVPEALLVTASFRNDARFAQAWPQLELSLADMNGDALGLRRFSPREYLGAAPTTPLLAPGQSASIALEILDPGKRAVAFDFEFR